VSLAKMMNAMALPITPRHEQWLALGDPHYSAEALEFAQGQLSRTLGGGRRRERLFRASGAGRCLRERMYSRLGAPEQVGPDTRRQSIFNVGNFMHLRWQMAGLTEGWLRQAEVPADRPDLGFGCTLDGILHDGSIFEAKSINHRGFVIVQDYGAKHEHVKQVHYMMLATETDAASLLYEDKDTQDYTEIRVHLDPEVMDEVRTELDLLMTGLATQSLPPMLDACAAQTGAQWRNCAFRDLCAKGKKGAAPLWTA
jgi:hypothetical protein